MQGEKKLKLTPQDIPSVSNSSDAPSAFSNTPHNTAASSILSEADKKASEERRASIKAKQQAKHEGVPVTQEKIKDNVAPVEEVVVDPVVTKMRWQPRPMPTVNENRPTTETLSDSDSNYVSIDLPSNFSLYKFDTLSIRPFRIPDIKKLYRARQESSQRMLGQAIGAAIDRNPFKMTVGDFYFLMYWLRINSFDKAPYEIKWTCGHPEHVDKVNDGTLAYETLKNVALTDRTKVETHDMDIDATAAVMEDALEKFGVRLNAPTFADLVTLEEYAEENGEEEDFKETYFMMKYASFLDSNDVQGNTLVEKEKWLSEKGEPALLFVLDKFQEVSDHSVVDRVKVTCKECGTSTEVAFSVDVLSFFPSL